MKSKDISTTEHSDLVLFADGGSRGNPGPSASGYVLYTSEHKKIVEGGEFLGETTNNQAEYHALKLGLLKARELGAKNVSCFMDSLLVINQMKGLYKVKNEDLWPVHSAIMQLAHSFENVEFSHVPRRENSAADAMVNKILDENTVRP